MSDLDDITRERLNWLRENVNRILAQKKAQDKKFTKEFLALEAGIGMATMRRISEEDPYNPGLDKIIKIAHVLRVTVADLLSEPVEQYKNLNIVRSGNIFTYPEEMSANKFLDFVEWGLTEKVKSFSRIDVMCWDGTLYLPAILNSGIKFEVLNVLLRDMLNKKESGLVDIENSKYKIDSENSDKEYYTGILHDDAVKHANSNIQINFKYYDSDISHHFALVDGQAIHSGMYYQHMPNKKRPALGFSMGQTRWELINDSNQTIYADYRRLFDSTWDFYSSHPVSHRRKK